ncbi:MAG: class I SAM-dependent methyltransferase [Thermoanaerobaculia bacterium]|nr:class I SAM-dependent methyltransferase [Thermoanaerobaculia bacterium]
MSGRAETYDDLPYGSRAVRESHPAHLAAVARLFGVDAPAPRTARVLELGCAEGGNLLPMAVGAPSAEFLGIDLSARQVEAGEARRDALGLTNVALRVADVATFDPGPAPFDYVIAHGLWSWVPEPVADALLALVARVLSPAGVAYVSYNTYPGWHLRGLVRDLLLRDTRAGADPAGRIARARELLVFAAANARDRSRAYGEVLRDTLAQFSRHDDARLFHEWLEENNRPVWFRDFAARAAGHGLEPLADARLAAMPMGRVKPEVDDLLSSRAEGRLEKEELLDVLRNRSFRQTLLVRAPGPGREEPEPAALDGLLFTTELVPVPGDGPGTTFRGGAGSLSTDDPRLVSALLSLHEAAPRAVPFAALASASSSVEELRPGLLRCVAAGLVEALAADVPCVAHAGPAPLASPLARLEAAEGPLVTSLAHRNVEVDPASRLLLAELDGRPREDVIRSFARRLAVAGLIAGPDGAVPPEAEVREVVAQRLDDALASLAKRALLLG